MFWTISIESDLKENLRVRGQDGHSGGEALVDFFNPLDLYCKGNLELEDTVWFEKLDSHMNNKLCEYTNSFRESIYAGDWNYEEDEYNFFMQRNPEYIPIMNEASFRQTIIDIKQKWRNIQSVMNGVAKLVDGMKNGELESTYWYEPNASIREFEALYYTLFLHSERGAETVRIRIE